MKTMSVFFIVYSLIETAVTVTKQQEGCGIETNGQLGIHVLPLPEWVLSRYSGVLPHTKNMQVRLIGNSKLPVL